MGLVRHLAKFGAVVTAVALLLVGCGSTGGDRSSSRQQLIDDLNQLRADDGLYTATVPSSVGLYNSAYGLTALSTLNNSISPEYRNLKISRNIFAAEINADPLWNRWSLALLESAIGRRIHIPSDIAALRSMHTSQGYFADPVADRKSVKEPGYQLAATTAAVKALASFGVDLPSKEKKATIAWLETTGAHTATTLTQLWHLVEARKAVGLPFPASVGDSLHTWWETKGSRELGRQIGDALFETCAYIRLAKTIHLDLKSQLSQLETDLDPQLTPPADLQTDDAVAEAWRDLGGDPARLQPLRQYVLRHQLPSKLLTFAQQRLGDLDASYRVETLRALAGLPTLDPELAAALRARRFNLGKSGPGATAQWLAVLNVATGKKIGPEKRELARRAMSDLPDLKASSAQQWFATASALDAAGLPVPHVSVLPWPPDTSEHRYTQNLAITELAKHKQLDTLPHPDAHTLADQGIRLLSVSLNQADAALSAAAVLGWRPTHPERDHIGVILRHRRGCPGTPALFRESDSTSTCDVYATLSAWRIQTILRENHIRGTLE